MRSPNEAGINSEKQGGVEMKIKIAYQDHEAEQAQRVADLVHAELARAAAVRVKHSDLHEPYKHIYMSQKDGKSRKSLDKSEVL